MSFTLLVPLGLLPSLAWLWVICRRDDHEREPVWLVGVAFALGAASTAAVLWLRPLVEDACLLHGSVWTHALLEAFVVTALVEEGCKLLALLPLCLHRELDEPLDGVVYGAAVALGFAAVENAVFADRSGSAGLVLQRAFTATLAHVCCTGSIGFALARAKLTQHGGPARGTWIAGGLALAVGIHGLYDLFLAADRTLALLSLLVVLPAALAVLALKVRWARARSDGFHPRPGRASRP